MSDDVPLTESAHHLLSSQSHAGSEDRYSLEQYNELSQTQAIGPVPGEIRYKNKRYPSG